MRYCAVRKGDDKELQAGVAAHDKRWANQARDYHHERNLARAFHGHTHQGDACDDEAKRAHRKLNALWQATRSGGSKTAKHSGVQPCVATNRL